MGCNDQLCMYVYMLFLFKLLKSNLVSVMSLPNGFNNSHEYFREAVDFLKQNSWIYREANTMFLKNGILNEMPQEYKDYFAEVQHEELNQFPYVHQSLDAHKTPHTITTFRQKLAKLIPEEAYQEPKYIEKQNAKPDNLKKMNIKKQHEIQRLASVIRNVLKLKEYEGDNVHEEKCVLIDFGSGLGYLSELLYKLNENLLILGLEADTYRVEAAEKRVKAYMPTGCNAIQYCQQFITENSKEFIVVAVEELLKLNYHHTLAEQQQQQQQITTKMAIIGLHACADLTITSMKLFFQLLQVQYLIIMPCCYHKLQIIDDCSVCKTNAAAVTAELKFRNFPISECLKKVLLANESDKSNYASKENDTGNYTTYLNRPFLRLACQQTLKRWSRCSPHAHCAHGCEMFLRAVAESLKPEKGHTELMIVKRKEEKIDFNSLTMEQRNAFDTFSSLYALKSKETNDFIAWTDSHRKMFEDIIEKYSNGCKLTEGLTCLQTSMQVMVFHCPN